MLIFIEFKNNSWVFLCGYYLPGRIVSKTRYPFGANVRSDFRFFLFNCLYSIGLLSHRTFADNFMFADFIMPVKCVAMKDFRGV